MKLKRIKFWDLFWLLLVLLLVFTPLGFHARVAVTRLFSFSPSAIATSEQKALVDYNWRLTNANGNLIEFESYKGDVILLNYWATWCPPCVAEMPSMNELYEKYGETVTFLFVTNDSKENIVNYMKKNQYTFPVYYIQENAPPLLASQSLPTTFIIGKEGKIKVKKIGPANWNSSHIHQLLDSLITP